MSVIRRSAHAVLLAFLLPAALMAQEALKVSDLERALLPLPVSERAGATVTVVTDHEARVVREGSGEFICIADDPSDDRFQAVCYHESLEAYMARGRELRKQGATGEESIKRRWEEIEAGSLTMPGHAMLHQVFGGPDWDGSLETAMKLSVIYVPFATAEELGLPLNDPTGPWVMYPGTPTAHIMIPG